MEIELIKSIWASYERGVTEQTVIGLTNKLNARKTASTQSVMGELWIKLESRFGYTL